MSSYYGNAKGTQMNYFVSYPFLETNEDLNIFNLKFSSILLFFLICLSQLFVRKSSL
jgi:hypothetical protein